MVPGTEQKYNLIASINITIIYIDHQVEILPTIDIVFFKFCDAVSILRHFISILHCIHLCVFLCTQRQIDNHT